MLVEQEQALSSMKGKALEYLKRILDSEHLINKILDENYNKIPAWAYDELNGEVYCIDVARIALARLVELLDAELHDAEKHTVDIDGKEIDEMEI